MPSAWNDHPSRNSTGLYTFSRTEIYVDQRIKVTKRNTYDVLDWLRDCGGLTGAIFRVGAVIIALFT